MAHLGENLAIFIAEHAHPYDAARDTYRRAPFAQPTKAGKNTAIYNAHSYHTKVPPLGIAPYIEHYTEPGDLILDPFCGSGMTGVAALMTARHAILNDLSPAAVHIARNFCTPVDVVALRAELDAAIQTRIRDTRRILLENFDEDVHERLRANLAGTREQLDRTARMLWTTTRFVLDGRAAFDDAGLTFDLLPPGTSGCRPGRYHLITKDGATLNRQSRQAPTLEEQHAIQEKIAGLERTRRRQRQRIFEVMAKRDGLISALERRMAQITTTSRDFGCWRTTVSIFCRSATIRPSDLPRLRRSMG